MKKGTGHVEKDHQKIGGCAAGCMIQGFIFSLNDEGEASEFMDDVSGWSQSLAFSFQAEINTSKMLGRSPLVSKGLDLNTRHLNAVNSMLSKLEKGVEIAPLASFSNEVREYFSKNLSILRIAGSVLPTD